MLPLSIKYCGNSKINCDKINTPEDSPWESRILELSVETRKELREKMASFYGTPAPEDKAIEA